MPETTLDPTTNPDVLEAERLRYSDGVIKVLLLSSGAWAIYGHEKTPIILDELHPDSLAQISVAASHYGRIRKARYAEARFHGEPNDKQFARDIRRANRLPTSPEALADLVVDI